MTASATLLIGEAHLPALAADRVTLRDLLRQHPNGLESWEIMRELKWGSNKVKKALENREWFERRYAKWFLREESR